MKLFKTSVELAKYIANEHRVHSVSYHYVEGEATLIGIRDSDGDVIQGYIALINRRLGKWALLDNFHADLCVRAYLEYVEEFSNALNANDEVEEVGHDKEESLGIDLDF